MICDKCGNKMVLRQSKNGPFLGCSNYPKCNNIISLSYGVCPKCNKGFVVRRFSNKKIFYGCSTYPECNFISNKKLSLLKCPKCGSYMYNDTKTNQIVCLNENCDYKIILDK